MILSKYLFNEAPLNEGEEDLLRQVFSNPVVIKYLRILAQTETSDFVGANLLQEPEELYARQLMKLQGKLAVVVTLLSISEPK